MIKLKIDTTISIIVVSLPTWEAHHNPRDSPSGCGELPRSLIRQQWTQYWYQFLYPEPAIYWVNLQYGLVTEDDMLPMEYIVSLFHLCAHSKRRRQWLVVNRGSLWVYGHGNCETRALFMVCWPAVIRYKSSSTPPRPEHLRCDLDEVWSSAKPPWTCLAQKFKWQHTTFCAKTKDQYGTLK